MHGTMILPGYEQSRTAGVSRLDSPLDFDSRFGNNQFAPKCNMTLFH
jgi:hypothetical protein